jgi:hypothetical protein
MSVLRRDTVSESLAAGASMVCTAPAYALTPADVIAERCGVRPLVVTGPRGPGVLKDTADNIRRTGEFVVNLVPESAIHGMNTTAITENSLMMLFCSRLTSPKVASSKNWILLLRKLMNINWELVDFDQYARVS